MILKHKHSMINLNNMVRDLKIYLLGGSAFALSFTNLESGFRIVLLGVSIIYTIINIYKLLTKKDDTNK